MSSSDTQGNIEKKSIDKRLANLTPGGPGRPKGLKNKSTLIREAFIAVAEAKDMSPEELDAKLEEIGIDKALKGDFRFWQEIRDRNYGKPVQRNENVNANLNIDKLPPEDKERLDGLIK